MPWDFAVEKIRQSRSYESRVTPQFFFIMSCAIQDSLKQKQYLCQIPLRQFLMLNNIPRYSLLVIDSKLLIKFEHIFDLRLQEN